jgi:hypothetical protein
MVAGASVLNLMIAAPLMIGITLIFGITDEATVNAATGTISRLHF